MHGKVTITSTLKKLKYGAGTEVSTAVGGSQAVRRQGHALRACHCRQAVSTVRGSGDRSLLRPRTHPWSGPRRTGTKCKADGIEQRWGAPSLNKGSSSFLSPSPAPEGEFVLGGGSKQEMCSLHFARCCLLHLERGDVRQRKCLQSKHSLK